MTKADLIEEVSRVVEMSPKESRVIVETIFDSIVRSLRGGDKVEIRAVVDRREQSRAKQVTQFARIHPVVLVAGFQQRVLARIAYDHFGHVRLQQVI